MFFVLLNKPTNGTPTIGKYKIISTAVSKNLNFTKIPYGNNFQGKQNASFQGNLATYSFLLNGTSFSSTCIIHLLERNTRMAEDREEEPSVRAGQTGWDAGAAAIVKHVVRDLARRAMLRRHMQTGHGAGRFRSSAQEQDSGAGGEAWNWRGFYNESINIGFLNSWHKRQKQKKTEENLN